VKGQLKNYTGYQKGFVYIGIPFSKFNIVFRNISAFITILIFIFFHSPYSAISSETLPFKTHKFITAYDFNEGDIPFIASHFEIMDTYLSKANQVQKIKNLNPLFKAIYYKNALTHREGATKDWEDWYVHDAQTGSRLVNKDWGWYLMDIGKQSYRISLANHIKNSLTTNEIFDGVFLDDVWGSLSSGGFYREFTKETGKISQSLIDSWHNNMKLLLIQIKMAIGNKLLIVNTHYSNTGYIVFSDGLMYEAFCHSNWQPFGGYYPEWQKVLEKMKMISSSGKIYLAQSGILTDASKSQTIKTAKYCYSMFLLGVNSNSYFYFSKNYRGVTYFPEWDGDLGSPIEDYHARAGTPLFEREYSKGLVLINPSSESVQINLGGEYKNLEGVITETIALGSHEGEILLKRSEN
jgi:hypothetical protein